MSTIRSRPIIQEIAQRDTVPVIVDSAPRVSLSLKSGGDTVIECRHVVTLLGAKSPCKAVLPHRKVAPVHAAVVNDGAHVFLVDLVTQQGTLLNGLKIEQERLTNGDVVSVMHWSFDVSLLEAESTGNADVRTVSLDAAHHTLALEHLDTGRVLKPNRSVCVMGRRDGCDVTLDDKSVSRTHAMLISYLGRPAVVDLHSRNSTLVNGDPVSFRLLHDGDVITLGDSKFRVRILGAVAKAMAGRNGSTGVNGNGMANVQRKANGAPRVDMPPEGDLIDIATTEGSQRWRVAETKPRPKPVEKRSGVA